MKENGRSCNFTNGNIGKAKDVEIIWKLQWFSPDFLNLARGTSGLHKFARGKRVRKQNFKQGNQLRSVTESVNQLKWNTSYKLVVCNYRNLLLDQKRPFNFIKFRRSMLRMCIPRKWKRNDVCIYTCFVTIN